MEPETQTCQNCKQGFQIEPDDFSFYEKMQVPVPVLCPTCRFKRRLLYRNERTLYKRTCGLCSRSMISMYNPGSPYTVYCNDCWLSDTWDPRSYAQTYDPSRPFFEQLKELIVKVPKQTTLIGTEHQSVNSEYVNFGGGNKNCYLLFNSPSNEDSMYCRGIMHCRDVADSYFAENAELCYECVNVNNCSRVAWGQNVLDSVESYFVLNCTGVQNCFGCINLRHKSYHLWNEPLPKEEWRKRVADVLGSQSAIEETKRRFAKFSQPFPRRENNNLRSVGCTGEYVYESKNCRSCFEAFNSEDCRYSFTFKLAKDSYDIVGRGMNSELLLEGCGVGSGSARIIGSWGVESSRDVGYSFDLRACADCFGCCGLKHAQYCILNRQYSASEYHTVRKQIVNELTSKNLYGLYLLPQLSPWAYNEAMVQEFFPLTKEKALAQGFRWEENLQMTTGKETVKPDAIPDHIKDVTDSVLNEILACTTCNRNYRLIKPELDFYRRMVVPVPRKCFNCRHADRLRRRGPYALYDRTCAKCGKLIQTSYAPDRPEIVYCEQCYNAEVV